MSSATVEAKVRHLLQEVQHLQVERNGIGISGSETEKAGLIQSNIFRKLAIIDNLMLSPGISVWRKALKDLVSSFRKENHAEKDDLEKMPIPNLGGKGCVSQSFLTASASDELRLILKHITSASDKVNLIEALPETEELMNWDLLSLQFEQILPIMQKRRDLDSKDILTLTAVSPNFRDAMIRNFENSMNSMIEHESRARDMKLRRISRMKNDLQLDSLEVLPVSILLTLPSRVENIPEEVQPSNKKDLATLDAIGSKVRQCYIRINAPLHEVYQSINDYLARMPNLQRVDLHLATDSHHDEGHVDCSQLPNLPSLKFLDLTNGSYQSFFCRQMIKGLLKKYYLGLSGLRMPASSELPTDESIQSPKLCKLEIFGNYLDFNARCIQHLNILVATESPLKTISLVGNYCRHYRNQYYSSLPDLMTALTSFGDTLEELTIKNIYVEKRKGLKEDPSWMMDLHLPKLRKFYLGYYLDDWSFLLQFPVLEELTIGIISLKSNNIYVPSQVMDFSMNPKSIRKSNIWKMLPCLRTISVQASKLKCEMNNFSRVSDYEEFTVTRSQCIASTASLVPAPPKRRKLV